MLRRFGKSFNMKTCAERRFNFSFSSFLFTNEMKKEKIIQIFIKIIFHMKRGSNENMQHRKSDSRAIFQAGGKKCEFC